MSELIPSENRQLVIHQFSREIDECTSIIKTDIPELKGQQCLIQNKYVGINAVYDRELYRGAVPYIDVVFPYVFGVEAVGEVIQLGSDCSAIKIGDQVGTVKVGTAYQEYQIVDQDALIALPEATPEYLTISPTGVSAYLAIEKLADLKLNEVVVVSAAAGGLGHIMVQLCKMKGCHVVAICGGTAKKDVLSSLGCCNRIINYHEESIVEVLDTEYKNKIDVAIDSVGRDMFDVFLRNIAIKGRLIVIGLASELADEKFEIVNQSRVYESIYWKGASVRCFMNHLYKDEHATARASLFKMYQEGTLKIKLDQNEFAGIDSIVDASKYLLAGKSCGKVLVKL